MSTRRSGISTSESNRQQTKTVYNLLVKMIEDVARLPTSGDELTRFAEDRTAIIQTATSSPVTQKAMTSMIHALNNLIEPGNIKAMIEQNPDCAWWGLFLYERAFDEYWNSHEMISRGLVLKREMRLFPHDQAGVKFSIVLRGDGRRSKSAPALRVVDFASASGSTPRGGRAPRPRRDRTEPKINTSELAGLAESVQTIALTANETSKAGRKLSLADETESEGQIVYEDFEESVTADGE